MKDYTAAMEARISRRTYLETEIARNKLAPGTWQHRMLEDHLKALRMAAALMDRARGGAGSWPQEEIGTALAARASMTAKTEAVLPKFQPAPPSTPCSATGCLHCTRRSACSARNGKETPPCGNAPTVTVNLSTPSSIIFALSPQRP